jgi:hypothetical protein
MHDDRPVVRKLVQSEPQVGLNVADPHPITVGMPHNGWYAAPFSCRPVGVLADMLSRTDMGTARTPSAARLQMGGTVRSSRCASFEAARRHCEAPHSHNTPASPLRAPSPLCLWGPALGRRLASTRPDCIQGPAPDCLLNARPSGPCSAADRLRYWPVCLSTITCLVG